jgi:diacylglycerol kinase family enzyme
MALDRQVLAVLPAGHGNCLARDLGCGELARAVEALRDPRPAPLDLLDARFGFGDGREIGRLCASTIAAGYVAQVVVTGRQRIPWLGGAAYAGAAMLTVPASFEVRFDGVARPQRRTGIVINNTAHLSNFRGLPDASVRDGLLDVMELDAGWPRQLLHNLAVLAGSRRFGPSALRQAPAVRYAFAEPCTVMADGELLRDVVRLEVQCRASAARCLVGRP